MIVAGTAGSASHMVNHCLRRIPVLVSVDPCTVSHIHIFQIGKMFLIKITDLLENLSSVDGCPCTGGKDFLLFFTGMNILTLTSGIRPSQCTVIIARIVQSVSVVKLDHSRRRMLFYACVWRQAFLR